MSSLAITIASLKLANPLMLASGIMDETGASMRRIAEVGAGAIVTKSIGRESRDGYPNPTLVELDYGYINAMGLPGPGIDDFKEEMAEAIKGPSPIIGSLFAATPEDFAFLAERMQKYGAAAVELNLSCPHAKGYGMEIGVDPEMVEAIVREVKKAINIPILAKLTPNTHLLSDVAKSVEKGGGDAIVAINTVKAMAISLDARRPILYNRIGGLSGPAIKNIGLRCVYELYNEVNIPIIGVGGIEAATDALEYMMAGASAVQIGSAIGRKGIGIFRGIANDMSRYLEANDMSNIVEVVGLAHE